MIRGMYTAASGMMAELAAQEVRSNNLANVDTTGYKKDMSTQNAFSSMLINRVNDSADKGMPAAIGSLGTGVGVGGVYTDFSTGPLKQTGNPLDVAFASKGNFFVIETPAGERYTRDGSFAVDQNGDMVTKDGYKVVGTRGPVNVNGLSDIVINSDGSISSNGVVVNELKVVAISDPLAVEKIGNNLYAARQENSIQESRGHFVAQGYLEGSNVNAVYEMVNMMNGLRHYEISQRSLQMQNGTLEKLINDVARV